MIASYLMHKFWLKGKMLLQLNLKKQSSAIEYKVDMVAFSETMHYSEANYTSYLSRYSILHGVARH